MSGVFISYRSRDGAFVAGLLYRRLVAEFGADEVFYAARVIPAGGFFDDALLAALRECEVLLAVIGPHWLTAADDEGNRMLDRPGDWVRREIAEALARGIRVIPLLVDDARPPTAGQLPADIRDLARCNALPLGDHHGAEDPLTALIAHVRAAVPRFAGVRPPAAASDAGRPRQLPADIRAFVGRAEELAFLLESDDAAAGAATPSAIAISAVDGMAGIGKTALALRAAHRLAERFPDGQLFVDLHGFTRDLAPVAATDALGRFLGDLGVPPSRIPRDEQARAALYRRLLSGTRTLILLDNALDEAQIRPLLPGSAGCLVLVTSRRRLLGLDDARQLLLGQLPAPDAAELLRIVIGPQRAGAEDPLLGEIAGLCGHIPLALRIAAARLRARPAWTLDHLAGLLRDQHERLELLDDGERSLAAALTVSYEHLSAQEQRMFRYLGLHPGPDFDMHAAIALTASPAHAQRLLSALVDYNLLAEPAPGRYQFHDLVRLHASALAAEEAEAEREDALDRLLDYYLHTSQAADRYLRRRTPTYVPAVAREPVSSPSLLSRGAATAWMNAELANLMACTEFAADNRRLGHAVALPAALHGFLASHGPWNRALALHERALWAARATADRPGEAAALGNLGDMQRSAGRYEESFATLGEAIRLFDELGDSLGYANALGALGTAQRFAGLYAKAEASLVRSLELSVGLGDRLGESNTLVNLGLIQYITGRFVTARDTLKHGIELSRELDNPAGEAPALNFLGLIEYHSGFYVAATDTLTKARDLFRELDDRLGEGNALNDLAQVSLATGRELEAIGSVTRALELFEGFGERLGRAISLNYLGRIRHALGDDAQALAALDQALELYRELGHKHAQANVLGDMGRVLHALGEYARARDDLTEALEIYREATDIQGVAEALNRLGSLDTTTDHLDQARAEHEEALNYAREIPSAKDEADALDGLANAYYKEGDKERALTFLREALQIFERMGADPDIRRVRRKLAAWTARI